MFLAVVNISSSHISLLGFFSIYAKKLQLLSSKSLTSNLLKDMYVFFLKYINILFIC